MNPRWYHCSCQPQSAKTLRPLAQRIMVLQQCARGVAARSSRSTRSDDLAERSLEHRLERVKHDLWHGNTHRALDELSILDEILESWEYDADGNPKL